MARRESDRENLMREATALKRRIALRVPGEPEPTIVGRRSDGALSFYFGPEPVFHFDHANRLRRAFHDGHLFRTQGNTLARLRRRRSQSATHLERRDLTGAERDDFLQWVRRRLEGLQTAHRQETLCVVEEVPQPNCRQESLLPEIISRLEAILQQNIALATPIPGKR